MTNTNNSQYLSAEALRLIQQHGINPTPHNYALWYEYAAKQNTPLMEELDKVIKHAVPLDNATSEFLYRKHIEPSGTATDEPEKARLLLTDILKVIGDATSTAQNYNTEIDDHITELESQSGGDLKTLVNAIIESARGLKKSGENLHQRLDESRSEINMLRKNLQEATAEAQRDFLTGLFNRKALDRMMDELLVYAKQEEAPLSLLMIDVDHFKHFNDEFGHLIGDEVLKMVARLLRDTVKGTDIVARFGGEEFVVILPKTPLQGAAVVAENIRCAIANKELMHKGSGKSFGTVTVSIGIAGYASDDSVPMLVKRADEALFAAKRGGRNRVSTSGIANAA
jgi:diguanylate cyclase